MENQIFHSIVSPGTGFFKDRGSRFFAYAYPVETLEEIEEHLKNLKKQYHDARHHCYAYRLGMKGEKSYSTDDGEPSHSAGAPILGAIRSLELSKVLVVVVRYFGGTKLGVRGLIEAYRTAAEQALSEAELLPLIPMIHVKLTFSYDQTSGVKKLLHPFTFTVLESSYTDICQQILNIRASDYPKLEQTLIQAGYQFSILT